MNARLKKTFLSGLILFCCANILGANTLDVPSTYSTIQSALNAASAGDTVLVQAGVYNESNITWPTTNGIKLIGVEGRDSTFIDAHGLTGSVINMQHSSIDSSTLISGFTIRNGWVQFKGAGLYLENAGPTLANLSILNNKNDYGLGQGGGIYCLNASPKINNCLIGSNAAIEGGGIFCMSSSLNISNSQILDHVCQQGYGGGLAVGGGSTITLDRVVIANNEAQHAGGIYCADSSSIIIRNSMIYSNYYGEINCMDNSRILIEQSEIGSIYSAGDTVTIRHSNIFSGISVANSQHIVTATHCWWGDESGPKHPTQNPSGQGAIVSQYVDVLPWESQPDTSAPPLPPPAIAVTESGLNSLVVVWNSSISNNLVGYKACYKTDENALLYSDTVDVGNGNSGTISGLLSGTQYYVCLISYDDNGAYSRYSYEQSYPTNMVKVQDLNIGGNEKIDHVIAHAPEITYNYFNLLGRAQTQCHIQVSSHADFSIIDMWNSGAIVSDTSRFTYAGSTLEDGGKYYLRVKVRDDEDWSDYADLSFRMNSKPSVPELLFPINNELVVHHPNLSFLRSTDPENDSLSYNAYIYNEANDQIPLDSIIAFSQNFDTLVWYPRMQFKNNNKYKWKVNSFDGYEGSAFSEHGEFIFSEQDIAPGEFSLLSPSDSTQLSHLQPTLVWQKATDPDHYDTVKYTLILDTPEPGVIAIEAGTDTSYTFSENLEDNMTYYWKIIATDLGGAARESNGGYRSFTLNTGNDAPTTPLIASPDSVVVLKLFPEFKWEASTDPDPGDKISYQMNVWNSSYSDSITTDSNRCVLADSLNDNSEYSWCVKAMDEHAGISTSETVTFWTDLFAEPPAQFSTMSPTHEEVLSISRPVPKRTLPTTSVTLTWHSAPDPDPQDIVNYTLKYKSILPDSTWIEIEVGTDTSYSLALVNSHRYEWQVIAKDDDGFEILSDSSATRTFDVGALSGIAEGLPKEFSLGQNYPNPFNPRTAVNFELSANSDVVLSIFNMNGKKVATLVNEAKEAGFYEVIWDASKFTSGIYFYRLVAEEFVETKKMIFMK